MDLSTTPALAAMAISALIWLAASIDALRRPAMRWSEQDMSKRWWTGMLIITAITGLGPIGGLLYFIFAFPRLRRGHPQS
ncbi:hypothetical protein Asi03nite_26120 [Actinoplanes siamensis]|uniref:Cardiolipin synthase N-terminal domain-containing protein n=1 Tax=Actinoplanes siamensis TaxID=1223317 RepID=A0A919N602_9ACTN|nr:hypothetical protein Asi03nite_26120 [Actinoplanes siamensis]